MLTQLQGARVVVTTASRTAQGAILTVEERKSQLDAQKPPSELDEAIRTLAVERPLS